MATLVSSVGGIGHSDWRSVVNLVVLYMSKGLKTYSVFELLNAGARFTDDYEPEDAIQKYMELHPDADEASVRAESQEWLAHHC